MERLAHTASQVIQAVGFAEATTGGGQLLRDVLLAVYGPSCGTTAMSAGVYSSGCGGTATALAILAATRPAARALYAALAEYDAACNGVAAM